jgi:hypothetical protein
MDRSRGRERRCGMSTIERKSQAMKSLALSAAILLLASAGGACSKTREAATLGPRNAHAMAYDQARRRVTLFGGADERQVRGDTWAWNGQRWDLLATEGPPPRTFPVMAYDLAHTRVLLFGGNRVLFGKGGANDTLLDDLWAWDGHRWTKLWSSEKGEDGPSARSEACGGYDEERRRFVVFGGYEKTGASRRRLGDTWEWDGAMWIRAASTGPSARSGATMTYVPARQGMKAGMVLFGGSTGTPPPQSDTWHWDGRDWVLLPITAEGGRFNAVLAYDAGRQALLRFGGWTGERRVDEFWRAHDGAWVRAGGPGPAGRNHSAWAYDDARQSLVLYGGHDGDRVFADTWIWDGVAWKNATERAPQPRIDNGH